MSLFSLLEKAVDMAEELAPLIGHGAPEVVALGQQVISLIDSAKAAYDTNPDPDTPRTEQTLAELSEVRETLEAQVNAHVDRTTAALRGEGNAAAASDPTTT